MRTQPAVKQEPAFEARFELALSNEGTAPAESVWVTFEVSDGLAFKNTRRVDDSNQDHNQRGTKTTGQRPVLGVPPIAPRWKKIYRRQSSSDASPLDTLRNAKGFGLGSLHNANTFRMALPADTLAQHAGIRAMMATEEKLRGIIGPHIDFIKNYTDSYGINFADPTWSGLPRDMSNPSPFLPLLSQLPEIPRHDPEAFYWKGRPATSHSKVWAFECSVLRHRIGPEIWRIPVVAWLDSLPRNGGCITVRVHGRNLRQPVEKKIPVKLRIREENSELVVRDVLPELMRR